MYEWSDKDSLTNQSISTLTPVLIYCPLKESQWDNTLLSYDFLKEVFNLRPLIPRFTHTWDVRIYSADILKEIGPNESPNLKRPTQKS